MDRFNIILDLTERYCGYGRFYHNLNHITTMLCAMNSHLSHLDQNTKTNLTTAIWYHDAVYTMGAPKGENEKESVLLFLEHHQTPRTELEIQNCDEISDAILSTINHDPTNELSKYLIDLDLHSLAAHPNVFARQNDDLYREFTNTLPGGIHPAEAMFKWCKGRIKFLEGFISKKTIYHTLPFIHRYETDARFNIQEEITRCKRKICNDFS